MSKESYEPLSKEDLKNLRRKTDEENRLNNISRIVKKIYAEVIEYAKLSTESVFRYYIPKKEGYGDICRVFPQKRYLYVRKTDGLYVTNDDIKFIEQNMTDIIKGLNVLFPDSSIEHKAYSIGNDGLYHELPYLNDKIKPFINIRDLEEYIIIDWSK